MDCVKLNLVEKILKVAVIDFKNRFTKYVGTAIINCFCWVLCNFDNQLVWGKYLFSSFTHKLYLFMNLVCLWNMSFSSFFWYFYCLLLLLIPISKWTHKIFTNNSHIAFSFIYWCYKVVFIKVSYFFLLVIPSCFYACFITCWFVF